MKQVNVNLRSEQVPAVKLALAEAEITHLSVVPIMGTAPKTEQQTFRGVERKVSLFRRVRIEVAVQDSDLEKTVEAMIKGAKESGGYGKIFITDLLDVVEIWTGKRGAEAL